MKISLLNSKVVFQRRTLTTDDYGNQTEVWEDYYSCYATPSGEGGSEKTAAQEEISVTTLSFTVRYCAAVKAITADDFRVTFGGDLYDIKSIDHAGYRNVYVKFTCEEVRR